MDLNAYFDLLKQNSESVIGQARKVPAGLLHHIPAEGQWSIIQILEHVGIVDRLITLRLTRPPEVFSETEETYGKEKINDILVTSRDKKLQAPDAVLPKGDIQDLETFERIFLAQRETLREYLETGKIVISKGMFKNAALGEMTISDWLYFIAAHAQRHVEQIKDRLKDYAGEGFQKG